ncbi:MAG: hypothetical protein ACFFE8_14810 [Candidatus Heimdallarchaeota archaeon]
MTRLLDHFLREEESYWSIQTLLHRVLKGMWVLLYGSRVIAFSEEREEIVRHFSEYIEKGDPHECLPGAICVQVGHEKPFYRIPVDDNTAE